MSFLCSIEKSTSGSLVFSIGPRQLLPFLYPLDFKNDHRRYVRHFSQGRILKTDQRRTCREQTTTQLDTLFITSLVKAGQCTTHAQPRPHEFRSIECRNDSLQRSYRSRVRASQRRGFFTQSPAATWGKRPKADPQDGDKFNNNTREELLSLVDMYDGESLTDQLPLLQLPDLKQPTDYPQSDLKISDEPDAETPNSYTWPCQGQEKADVEALLRLIHRRDADAEKVYELYRALPPPRITYISSESRHRLLKHLSVVETRTETAMLRYFSVIEDLNSQGMPLKVSEWTSAISFAGRYVARTTDTEVQACLRMWRDMEHVAGIRGNNVTFNVLFDMAAKAGKFKLADMIYSEMRKRGYQFNRYHYVSLIYLYGLKRDGTGARQAYRQLVEAGEVVDTVVLNAVITALLKAGEESSAELVYERMKRLHAEKPNGKLPPTDFRKKREIGKQLIRVAELGRKKPEKREELHRDAIVAPDTKTFRLLINHSAVLAGDFDKVSKFVEEMKVYEIPVHPGIFLALFKGFALHGGVRYTHWTSERLDSVWNAYMATVNREIGDVYLGKWIIIWALRAFAKCSSKEKVMEIWEECKMSWEPKPGDIHFVNEELHTLLELRPGPLLAYHEDELNELY